MRTLVFLSLLGAGCHRPEPHRRPAEDSPSPTVQVPALAFAGAAPRNLLMISIDTLRRDHVGRYAGTGLTPFLDQLAAEGVPLDDFTACSNWTFAATPCVFQGRSNVDNGFLPRLDPPSREKLPPSQTLASLLADRGMATVLVSANAFVSPLWNNSQGYQVADPTGTKLASALFDIGVAQLQAVVPDPTIPWFLHVHLMEPHAPYVPPDSYLTGLDALDPIPWDLTRADTQYAADLWPTLTSPEQALLEQHLRVRYAGEVRYLDDQIAAAWSDLDARGLLDDTLVVVWTDHGEAFWEHGHQTHAWLLHGEENDAVALFWAKNLTARPFEGPTTAMDLAPTILQQFGVPIPPEFTGIALGEAPEDRARFALTVARDGVIQSVRKGRWKLIFNWRGELQLFDVVADPGEAVDLYRVDHPELPVLWEALRDRIALAEPLAPEWELTWPEGLQAP